MCVMYDLAKVLKCHGVEAINSPDAEHSPYWLDTVGLYLNVGDPYIGTVIADLEESKFILSDYAEFIDELATKEFEAGIKQMTRQDMLDRLSEALQGTEGKGSGTRYICFNILFKQFRIVHNADVVKTSEEVSHYIGRASNSELDYERIVAQINGACKRKFGITIINKEKTTMITEPGNRKKFTLTIEVDVTQLEVSYKEADPTFTLESTEDIEQTVIEEFGWLKSSGISIKEIEEVEE